MLLLIESHVFVLVTTNNTPFLPRRTKYSPEKLQSVRIGTRLWLFHKPCVVASIRSCCSRSRWQSRLHGSESVNFPFSLPCKEGCVLALCIASHPSSCNGKGKCMTLVFLAHTWKVTVPRFLPCYVMGVEEMVPRWLDGPRPFQLKCTNLFS